MTDHAVEDRHRLRTLCLAVIGGAVLVGAALGSVLGGLGVAAQWIGNGEWSE